MTASPPPVALAYLHPGMVAHSFMASVLQTLMLHPGLTIWPIRSGPLAIPESRNFAVGQLLDSDLDWLWFADADMGFAPTMLGNLLAVADPAERPVVTAPAMTVIDSDVSDGMGGVQQLIHPNLYVSDGNDFQALPLPLPEDALLQVDGCGAAMLLIHRSVLEKLGPACFDRLDGLGEDLSFCTRLAQAGFPLHAHTGLKTTHYKPMWLS